MKKLYGSILILMMSVVIGSCSNSSSSKDADEDADKENCISHLKTVAKEISKHGNEWDESKMKEIYKDVIKSAMDFYKGMPSKEEIKEFDKAGAYLDDAIESLDEGAISLYHEVKNSPEIEDQLRKLRKARKKAKKNNEENENDNDE